LGVVAQQSGSVASHAKHDPQHFQDLKNAEFTV